MTKSFLPFQFLRLGFVFIAFWFLHNMIVDNPELSIYKKSGFWRIYVFLIPVTFLGIFYIYKSFKKDHTSVIKSFMILTIVKMIGSLAFLAPWLLYKDEFSRPFAIQFFMIFFPILLLETLILVKMINIPTPDSKKNG